MALHLAEPDQLQIGTEPPYDAEPVDWPFNATKAYLLDEASLAETATRFASPIDELYIGGYEEQAHESVFFIQQTFCAILPQIPHDHPGHVKLAKLVVDLMNRPSPSGAAHQDGGSRNNLPWADLRAPECRYSQGPADEMVKLEKRGGEYYPQYETDGAKLGVGAIKAEWTRHNAFLARLVTTPGALDYEKYALISMQGALEESAKTAEEISANVPAAAVWIFYAGEHIYKSRREWSERWTPAQGGPLWNGKKGFCPERWALWKDRFQWVTMQENTTDEAREFAGKAVRKMSEIESLVGNTDG